MRGYLNSRIHDLRDSIICRGSRAADSVGIILHEVLESGYIRITGNGFELKLNRRLCVFIGMVLTLSIVSAYYVGTFIVQMGGLSHRQELVLYTVLWSVFPVFIISDVLRRTRHWKIPYVVGAVLLGSYSVLVAVCSLGYVALFFGMPPRLTVVFCTVGAVELSLLALITNARGPKVTEIDLSTCEPFSGRWKRLTIVHLSDIHLSNHTRLSWVESMVEKTNALSPDLIVFTGDLIDVHPDHIPEHIQALSKLEARYGKFAVSGNHDVMMGIETFYNLCETLGFVCLDHQQVQVEGLQLVGMPDELLHYKTLPVIDQTADHGPVIFLKHRPTRFAEAVNAGVHLQLSGHSHKGQMPPWGLLVRLRYRRYAYGLHRYKQGYIFTTLGTGVWGPPMRLFSRSEIVRIRI